MFFYAKNASSVGFSCPDLTQAGYISSEELEDKKFIWLETNLAPNIYPHHRLEGDEQAANGEIDAELIGVRPVLKKGLATRHWHNLPSKTITHSDFEYNGRGPRPGNWGNTEISQLPKLSHVVHVDLEAVPRVETRRAE